MSVEVEAARLNALLETRNILMPHAGDGPGSPDTPALARCVVRRLKDATERLESLKARLEDMDHEIGRLLTKLSAADRKADSMSMWAWNLAVAHLAEKGYDAERAHRIASEMVDAVRLGPVVLTDYTDDNEPTEALDGGGESL